MSISVVAMSAQSTSIAAIDAALNQIHDILAVKKIDADLALVSKKIDSLSVDVNFHRGAIDHLRTSVARALRALKRAENRQRFYAGGSAVT